MAARKPKKAEPTYRPVCVHLKGGIKVIGGRIRFVCKDCGALLD